MTKLVPAITGFLFGVAASVAGFVLFDRYVRDVQGTLEYEELLDSIDEPLALVDDGEIQFSNDAFRDYSEAGPGVVSIDSALSRYPELREKVQNHEEGRVLLTVGDEKRCYDVSRFPVGESTETQLLFFHDVTAEHERRQRLEDKNEQLDRFASLISHDLRNPLDVAIGRTNAVRELNDDAEIDSHLESTQNALERMRGIITDVLTLARHGKDIGETFEVSLREISEKAWETVETADITLDVRTDAVVTANPDGLTHVLENLFRNTAEHAGSQATVTIDSLPDGTGFYIEDDGQGIPEECRERLFEAGESGDDTGTGLGLAIVRSIATAHGWEVEISEAETGGARFEFSGVELGDPVPAT